MGRLINPQKPSGMPVHKYRSYEPFRLPDRTWPEHTLDRAPIWCSVDLRDGNQALIDPMGISRKRRLFDLMVRMGFKEIEVGYPTACQDDWDFTRDVIERDAIPDDVTIQVMTPIREELIDRTVGAIEGAPRAILQIYNPTSELQRRIVLGMSRAEVRALALRGAERALRLRDSLPGTDIALQYATESFSQTEPEFALEVCNAVLHLWQPTADRPARIVFPATVECYPPMEYADRIEWMHRNLDHRDAVLLTVHPHNDRGTGVAATERALRAGAERVEGTLLANGERAGNVCMVTLAMNLFSQGVDPQLDLSDIDDVRRVVEECYAMPVSPRHPWVGDFVYTSFAGPHQDAISKGLRARADSGSERWDVPYLPIDPHDVGRDYKALIRISSQSGKGGVAYLMRTEHGLDLPRRLQIEFAALVQAQSDSRGGELTPAMLWRCFHREYLQPEEVAPMDAPVGDPQTYLGNLVQPHGLPVTILDLHEQPAARRPAGACAYYAEVKVGDVVRWGAGVAPEPDAALARCLHSAIRRALDQAPISAGAAGSVTWPSR
jgi:2-isopropylmalate synthase